MSISQRQTNLPPNQDSFDLWRADAIGAIDPALSHDPDNTVGLNFAYRGGWWPDGTALSAGVLTLTDNASNFIEVNPATHAIGAPTDAFTGGDWLPEFEVTTADGEIAAIIARRSHMRGGLGGSGKSNVVEFTQTAHGFAVGDWLVYNGIDAVWELSETESDGVISDVPDADTFKLTTAGLVEGLAGLEPDHVSGPWHFLDPDTPGGITPVAPTGDGEVSAPVLKSLSTTSGIVRIMRGMTISTVEYAVASDVVLLEGAQVIDGAKTFLVSPIIPTAGPGTNSTAAASTAYVDAAISVLINMAPGTLDTLGEIATQLVTDEGAVSALTSVVAGKLTTANNLSELSGTASTARGNLGLGSMAVQAAGSVAITGGSITGITDLAIADGGTGASTAADARTNLGLVAIAASGSAADISTGTLASARGGTGVSNAGTLTNAGNTTITGGGTLALGGFTLTAPATGTAALLATAQTFTAAQTIAAGTLADDGSTVALTVTATMPTTPSTSINALFLNVTSAGSAAQRETALWLQLTAGYTGSNATYGAFFNNTAASTGTNPTSRGWNVACRTDCGGTGGFNAGTAAVAQNATTNVALYAEAITNKASGSNCGILTLVRNAGASGIQCGGYISLRNTAPTFVSAALVADNAGTASDILELMDNSTVTARCIDGGNWAFGGSHAPAAVIHAVTNDAATATVVNTAILGHDTSGTAAANYGTGLLFRAQDSTTSGISLIRLRGYWNTATHSGVKARGVLSAFDGSGGANERDCILWGADGSAAMVGFYGVGPVARAAAYTPTNVTTDRSYDANATTIDEVADVLGTLVADLQAVGLIS